MAEKCRLCLNTTEVKAFAASIGNIHFDEKLKTVFTFPITIVESLPSTVCSECEKKVEQFHIFHEQVKHNQDLLWVTKKQECFEEVKVVATPDMDYSELGLPFGGSIEHSESNLVDPDENDEERVDLENDRICSLESDEEIDNDTDEDGHNQACVENEKKEPKNTLSIGTRSGKSSKENAERKKFNPTDETNQRLQEFYDMQCEICAQKFNSFTTLKVHYHQQHQTRGYIKCCGRKFSSRYRLLEHLSYHVGASMVRCDICNKNFSSRSYLLVHNSRIHGRAEDRPFKCTQCHQSYALECHLKAHMVSHVRVKCTICGKQLSSSLTLRTHMTTLHGKRENHICESCGKEFRTRQAFERHAKLHLGLNVVEQAQCQLCSKWLNSKRALKEHIKHVHTEAGQTFKCELCANEFPNSRALSDHKVRVHVEERFACEVCGKRFKRQIYLREHSAIHTGKPLYSCDVCGATFNSKANKYSHRKNKHPAEWEARQKQLQLQTESTA